MRRFVWTWMALAAVAVLLALTLFDGKRIETKTEQEEQSKFLIKFSPETITQVEIANKTGTTLILKRTEAAGKTSWHLTAPISAEADSESVQGFLTQLTNEKSEQTVVEGAEFSPAAFGLDQPVGRIVVEAGEGKKQEVRIGSMKAYNNNLYAQLGGESRALLVSGGWDILLAKLPKEFRNKHLWRSGDTPFESLKRITITHAGERGALEIIKEGDKWQIKGRAPLNHERVATLFKQVKDLKAIEVLEGESLALAKKALLKPELIVEVFADKTEPVFSLRASPEVASKVGAYFAASTGVQEYFSIRPASVEALDKTEQDFFDKRAPFQFKMDEVEKVEFATPEIKGSFDKKDGGWTATDPDLQKRIDSAKLSAMLEKLSRMEALRIFSPLSNGEKEKLAAHVSLKKKNGEMVFQLSWGKETRVEKAAGRRPEGRFAVLATSLSDHAVGLAEAELASFGLKALKLPEPTPTPTPGTGAEAKE